MACLIFHARREKKYFRRQTSHAITFPVCQKMLTQLTLKDDLELQRSQYFVQGVTFVPFFLNSDFSNRHLSPPNRRPNVDKHVRQQLHCCLHLQPQQRRRTQGQKVNRNPIILGYTREQRRWDKHSLVVSISNAPTRKLSTRISPTI